MDRKTLSVLLIEDSSDYARLVQPWLCSPGEDIAFVLNWTDSLIAGLARLAQGGIDVVLLDLGLADSDGVGTFLATGGMLPGYLSSAKNGH
jgi:CheY-like chemotaxis protein